MQQPATVQQVQDIDRVAIEERGIPSLFLMENAGRSVAEAAQAFLRGRVEPSACVFCGTGNNGGDGFVAVRHLLSNGIRAKTFLLGRRDQLKQDAAVNYGRLIDAGERVEEIDDLTDDVSREVLTAGLVIDAIFGVGLNREIRRPFCDIIQRLNKTRRPILAVDVPSGLDATTGESYGACIKAQTTVTFTYAKQGFFRNQGPDHVGKIIVADIGIPRDIIEQVIGAKTRKTAS